MLNDFPENEKAHCLRFDLLYENEAFDAAEAVLKRIEKYEPNSPYLAARRVALKADQQQFDEAVRAAMHMMTIPYDVGDWCRIKVRGAFNNYRQLPKLVGEAVGQWQNGIDIEPNCFRMIVDDILESWRDHEGCELWVVSNYIIAIQKSPRLQLKEKLQLILETAQEAVQTLPADNLIQYVICKYCESALRLGKDEQFLAWAHQYNNILQDTNSGYWTPRTDPHLPWTLIEFMRLMKTEPKDIKMVSKKFKIEAKRRSVRKWVRSEWKRRVKQIQKNSCTTKN